MDKRIWKCMSSLGWWPKGLWKYSRVQSTRAHCTDWSDACCRCRLLAKLKLPLCSFSHVAQKKFCHWFNAKKAEAEANGRSEVKVQLHVYLFPPLGPFRGPQSLWPEGEQVLNASLAAAAVLAKHVSRVVRRLFHPVTELLFKAKANLSAKSNPKKIDNWYNWGNDHRVTQQDLCDTGIVKERRACQYDTGHLFSDTE